MDQRIITAVILFAFVLVVILSLAWVINKVVGKLRVNGAGIYFWLLVAANVALHTWLINASHTTVEIATYAGKMTGVSLPFILLAFFMSRSLKKRKARQSATVVARVETLA
ncbi:hypothetical protein ASC78_21760 [Variovorax sp. Root318D1]|uniref:hypothetical protein n=1 Tax=Variovorax sp. Root318D1 TaxID=1736513 RepID=UPI00070134AD|nr:hypothetical protein [Variovorax sp. Root318D1]KQU89797.1 hypothetical protein ASC78_21760 [Variovorax sp. Root318D1]